MIPREAEVDGTNLFRERSVIKCFVILLKIFSLILYYLLFFYSI